MKTLILLLITISLSLGEQHLFMVNKYEKEIELEAKIISKIASSSIKDEVKIFIPDISQQEQDIYSRYFNLTEDCDSANFVFDNKGVIEKSCKDLNKLFFTNNYKRLVSNEKYYGAFFWSKSRPNIVFVKQRLKNNNIELSKEYSQFIEEFDD